MNRDHFSIKIPGQSAPRRIGAGSPAFVIAEIAQAHDGSLGFAHSFIDLAAELGADAIKFQTHIADVETTLDEPWRVPFSYQDTSRFAYWQRMEFTPEQWAGLFQHAVEKRIVALSSAFSVEAVELLEKLAIPLWKLASGEGVTVAADQQSERGGYARESSLFDSILATKKPVLVSTGMADFQEIDRVIEQISQRNLPYGCLQCTSQYPTAMEEVGLNIIDEMHKRYGCPVGLSDHSASPFPALAAMARGASIIEVHLCLHKMQFGPDTPASLDPDQFRLVTSGRDAMFAMLDNPVDKDQLADQLGSTRAIFTRSLAFRTSKAKGECVAKGDLVLKKPGTGIPASMAHRLIGKRLKRAVSASKLPRLEDFE